MTQSDISSLLITHTEQVFSVMLGMGVSPRSSSGQPGADGAAGGIVSVVGLVGKWTGTGTVCCRGDLACKISSRMLLTEYDAVNDDVLDAVGEITNMIIGNFKDSAEYALGPMGLSTPTVLYGENFCVRSLNGQVWTTVVFDCEGSVLEVKVCLAPSHRHDAHRAPVGASGHR